MEEAVISEMSSAQSAFACAAQEVLLLFFVCQTLRKIQQQFYKFLSRKLTIWEHVPHLIKLAGHLRT